MLSNWSCYWVFVLLWSFVQCQTVVNDQSGNQQYTFILSNLVLEKEDTIQQEQSCDPFGGLSDPQISLFVTLLQTSKLTYLINSNSNITIFAPKNDPLDKFMQNSEQSGQVEMLKNGGQLVYNLVAYHIVKKSVNIDGYGSNNNVPIVTYATNAYNQSLLLGVQGGIVQGVGSSAKIISGPQFYCGITLYVIDEVLLPLPKQEYQAQEQFFVISDLLQSLMNVNESPQIQSQNSNIFVDQSPQILNNFVDQSPQNSNNFVDQSPQNSSNFVEYSPQNQNNLNQSPPSMFNFVEYSPQNSNNIVDQSPQNLNNNFGQSPQNLNNIVNQSPQNFNDVFESGQLSSQNSNYIFDQSSQNSNYVDESAQISYQNSPSASIFVLNSTEAVVQVSSQDMQQLQQIDQQWNQLENMNLQSSLQQQIVNQSCESILDIVNSHPQLSLWRSALQLLDHNQILTDKQSQITMFAPTDASLRKILGDISSITNLINLKDKFSMIFGKHIILGKYSMLKLLKEYENGKAWTSWDVITVAQEPLKVQSVDFKGLVTLEAGNLSMTIIEGDIHACDSMVHVTDGIIANLK